MQRSWKQPFLMIAALVKGKVNMTCQLVSLAYESGCPDKFEFWYKLSFGHLPILYSSVVSQPSTATVHYCTYLHF